MPWPSSVQQGSGELRIDATFSVALTGHTEPRLDHSVARFLKQLNRETAFPNLAKVGNERQSDADDSHRSRQQRDSGTRRRRELHAGSHRGRREAERRDSARRDARLANVPAVGRARRRRLRCARRHDQRSAALPMARIDVRRRPPLHSARRPAAQYRRHGSREDERLPLAPF